MNERIVNRSFILAAMIMVVICFAAHPCFVLADGLTGSLTICYRTTSGDTVTQIDGAIFSVDKIADYDENLQLTSKYGEFDFESMTADDIEKLAAELSESIAGSAISGVTDRNGAIVFPNLDTGIYLVRQTGSEGRSSLYETSSPFLVAIPSDDGYDVICYPKTSIKNTDVNVHDTHVPKTGDGMKMRDEIAIFVTGGALLIGVLAFLRGKGGDDGC